MKHLVWLFLGLMIGVGTACEESAVSESQTIYEEAKVGVDSLSNVLATVYEDYGALQARHDNLMNEARSLSAVDSTALMNLQRAGNTLNNQATILETIEDRLDSFYDLEAETATVATVQQHIDELKVEYPDMNAKLKAVRDALNVVRTTLDGVKEKLVTPSTDE